MKPTIHDSALAQHLLDAHDDAISVLVAESLEAIVDAYMWMGEVDRRDMDRLRAASDFCPHSEAVEFRIAEAVAVDRTGGAS